VPYSVQPLPFKPSRLNGLSERLLASHYENNYGGAVRRLSAIEQRLKALDWDKAAVFEINGLKREELIAANSMILHEAYFDGLGGSGAPVGALAQALERDFGSVAAWTREFTAMGKAQAGGSGWTLLTWSPRLGRLANIWAADHTHTLGDGAVVLALDMYEHAYHIDFGAKAAAYVDAFMRNIAWDRVGARFDRAVASAPATPAANAPGEISAEALRDLLGRKDNILVLDVRKDEDLVNGADMLPSAQHLNPEQFEQWAATLPKDRLIVAYCVYGFQVSRDPVAELRKRGYDARSLSGGIAAWHAIGAPTVPKS
jgi:superoxide dismutase, Fe-Mn family